MTQVHDDWLLTAERLAIHRPTRTAVVADVHLDYDRTRVRHGEALPLVEEDELVQAVARLAAIQPVERLVVAGDLFESVWADETVLALKDGLVGVGVDLVVVPGNHDRQLPKGDTPVRIHREGLQLGRWRVVHGDGSLPAAPVVLGHYHPCLRWPGGVTALCYLSTTGRLMLPAFSRDAAGVNVLNRPEWAAWHCHVVTGGRVLDFGPVARLKQLRRTGARKKA